MIPKTAYLYQETMEMSSIFFIKEGELAFVLPSLNNAIYLMVKKGEIIGFEDYVYHLSYNYLVRFDFDQLEKN